MNSRFSVMTRIRLQLHHAGRLLLTLYLTSAGTMLQAQDTLEGLPFKDALSACVQAVESGDLQKAAELFQNLEKLFGQEDLYRQADAQQQILPLKGLAELGAGKYRAAATTLQSLQDAFPSLIDGNGPLLYGLAQAHRGSGNLKEARNALETYVRRFAGTTEAHLASLERADLFIQENLVAEGLEALDQLHGTTAPESLKMQAQLNAVQACLDDDQLESATRRMLDTAWSISTMPELAQLTFSALRCGEYAMSTARYRDALRIFQLVPPKTQLIQLQKQKLAELSTRILSGRRRALLSNSRHQQTFLTTLEARIIQQLKALETSEDYTPTFYLHYGQCLLFDEQFYKAWLVFEYMALNEDYAPKLRQEAHYRWVICAHQLTEWEEALTIARNFVDRYPESELAPQALYLIAKAHLEQRRYPESIVVLSDLIDRFPEHNLYGRWLFTRGFNQVVLESFEHARADFQYYLEGFPSGQLAVNARLWTALTYFFEKNYPICIEQLTDLLETDTRHPLYPEILYRLASTYYSSRDYDSAQKYIESYLSDFNRHQRVNEARVLKGDLLMGSGELEDAVNSFQMVDVESPDLFLYSVFQIGKIFRALEIYEEIIDHFQTFVEGDSFPRRRLSEGLYWLGWAYQQQNRVDLAYPLFEDALNKYGNDPLAGETQSILQALEKLKKRQSLQSIAPESGLARAADFRTWIIHEINRASQNELLTYLSRLVLYFHNRYGSSPSGYSLEKLADTVPLEMLDPEALGRIGLKLLEIRDERAVSFLSYLVDHFGRSNARAMGFLGLAKLATEKGAYAEAKDWLVKSSEEVPRHEHMHESQLLYGRVLSHLEEYAASISTFEQLLRLKSARGRPQAMALAGIAEAYEKQNNADKAIAYYQRIYNMYRAYPDLVSRAYWKSAQLFEILDKLPEAVKTLEEMLDLPHLSEFPEWPEANKRLPVLLPQLPAEPVSTDNLKTTVSNENDE